MTAKLNKTKIVQTPRNDNLVALYIGLTYDQNRWLPMMRISWDEDGNYYHSYTKAYQKNYVGLEGHVINPKRGYTQTLKQRQLIEILSDRIPRRPDSMEEYELLGLREKTGDVISLLARNGGRSRRDNYSVLTEINPDSNNNYHFYFPLDDICRLAKAKEYTSVALFNSLEVNQRLQLRKTNTNNEIYHSGICISNCPNYINYLLYLNPKAKLVDFKVERINPKADYYRKVVVKLSIFSPTSIYNHISLQPINPMPT